MNAEYEEGVRLKYKKLWLDYKFAVTGAYFCNQTLAGNGAVFQWEGPGDIKAAEAPPLHTFLAAPQLSPELAKHLPAAEGPSKQQRHKQ